MRIETIPVHADNYAYLVVCETSGQAAAVDPADARGVAARADALGVEVVAIWNTHHHFDHTGGNDDLVRLGKERGQELRLVGHRSSRLGGLTDRVDDGDEVVVGSLQGRVIHTPGHTGDAVVYVVEDAVFTGDTLFGAGCGRLFEGDAATMFASLERLAQLPDRSRIFFGHEYTAKNLAFAKTVDPANPALDARIAAVEALRSSEQPTTPSLLEQEKQTNPFLRSHSVEIRAQLHLADADAIAVFARLRALRNDW